MNSNPNDYIYAMGHHSLIGFVFTDIALDLISQVHAHIGDGCILANILLISPASGEGEEDGGGNRGEILIVEGDQS